MGAITSLIKGLLPRSQGAFRGSRGPAASGNEKAFLNLRGLSHAVSVAWSLVLVPTCAVVVGTCTIRYLIPVFPLIFPYTSRDNHSLPDPKPGSTVVPGGGLGVNPGSASLPDAQIPLGCLSRDRRDGAYKY